MSTAVKSRGRGGDRYLDLVRSFPLRPLRTEATYRRAMEVIDRLAAHEEGSLSDDEQDYFDTLTLLVEQYESDRPVDTAAIGPVEALKHLMEANDMSTTELGKIIGSKGVASEVLNGKRELSKAHIAALAERFNVDVSLFFALPAKKSTARRVRRR
jgi:HTH-type transcriptional regulator / antitoxin HigA